MMSLKDKVILFLGNTRFDSPFMATSLFIARELAKNNKVYFIDQPSTIKDYINQRGTDQSKLRQSKFSPFSDGLLDTDIPNLKIIITPPVAPINFLSEGLIYRIALKINEAIISRRINKILKASGIKNFIYINSFNFHYPGIANSIKPRLTVYQCVDPMVIPYDMKHGIISENMLVQSSDLVICTSKALYNEKKSVNSNTFFVPNAADVAHCSKALAPALPVHKKIKDLTKPVIGYLGAIERRMDYDLLMQVAENNPEKNFVFAGPVWESHIPTAFFKIANIHLIGQVPYDEIPQLYKGFDVAIIPFKKDEVSKTIFPLKLFEYLAAGKPVVITDFNPDLKDYTGDVVSYADSPASFTMALNEALANNSDQMVAKRVAVAQLNSWEKRSEDIAAIISSHLK